MLLEWSIVELSASRGVSLTVVFSPTTTTNTNTPEFSSKEAQQLFTKPAIDVVGFIPLK